MYLNGTKAIAILLIVATTTSALEVLEELQHGNSTSHNSSKTFYELNLLNDFIHDNLLHRVVIIFTPSINTLYATKKVWRNNVNKDKFVQSPLIKNLTENYRIQFINTLHSKSYETMFGSPIYQLGMFMKYGEKDEMKKMILNSLSMKEKFGRSLKWLLLMENIIDPLISIQKALGDLNLLLDADITVAVESGRSTLDLYDVYKICHKCGSPLEIVYKGNWTLETGLNILNIFRYGIAIRRNNFKMYPVKAATAIVNKLPSFNMTDLEYLNNDKDFLDRDAMQRKTYQLLKLMENLYNFTFDVKLANTWGSKVNGSWTGIVGMLYYHQAELSLSPLRYLSPRIKACDYTRKIHYERIHFVFRHPKHTSIRNIFFEPLTDIVWWCVLALIIATILLLTVHVHAEYKIFTKWLQESGINGHLAANDFQLPKENQFDFIVLCIMEVILMQGPSPELFRCNSTRLLIVSISIFSILLMQFYGAFIVSSLLSEAPRTITNLKALYNSSLELGMENLSYHYDVFTNNSNPLIQNLYKYRICNTQTNRPNVMSLEEGAKKIGKGNFAFHVAIDRVYRLLATSLSESQLCELQEIKFHPFFTFTVGIGMRKLTPYYEFITLAIAMFQESALLQYNDKKWEVNKIDCTSIQNEEVEVDLEHFAPALAFLSIAIIISLLALIIEILYKKFAAKFFKNANK